MPVRALAWARCMTVPLTASACHMLRAAAALFEQRLLLGAEHGGQGLQGCRLLGLVALRALYFAS